MLIVLPDELAVLREMQPLDRDVFNYLAERVDFETGVIGKARGVSYGGIALDLSERDQSRRAKGKLRKLTSKQVENSVGRLVTMGLLERMSGLRVCDSLILRRFFWAKALHQDNSAKNPDGSKLGAQLGKLIRVFKLNNNNLNTEEQSRWEGKNVSDGTTSKELLLLRENEKFAMFLEWQPSQDELNMIFHRAGVDKSKIKPEWISEFIGHWWGEGKRSYTQREWTARFGKQMISFLRNPSRADELVGLGAVKSRSVGTEHYPDWAQVPRNDSQLVSWMVRHGYGEPLPGHDYRQARAHLQRAVDIRLNTERSKLS
ncbi:MAG: DnaT-like ssDNA-binding domain-containing protein [Methylobacter sp.]|jgi:hypothetical protein